MGKTIFKTIVSIIISITIVGIYCMGLFSQRKVTSDGMLHIADAISRLNSELPRPIGTIGSLEHVTFSGNTLTYELKVNGSDEIMNVYTDNYDEVRDLLMYNFILMNGQNQLGTLFAEALNNHNLNFGVKIYTESGKSKIWSITGEQIKQFVKSCQLSPTQAMQKVIDISLQIANLELPLSPDDANLVANISTNSIVGDIDESCLLQKIEHQGYKIIFEYKVYEQDMENYEALSEQQNNIDYMNAFVSELVQDKDVLEFTRLVAISHSDMVLVYQGDKTGKHVSVEIPYTILREHCQIPSNLLKAN